VASYSYRYSHTAVPNKFVYLISSDVILDANNKNIGNDLLRRLFGSFFYYYKYDYIVGAPYLSNQDTIKLDTYSHEIVADLIDRNRIVFSTPHSDLVQYFAVNPARVGIIDDGVDIPNLKIPFRLFADKDDRTVLGDYHWKQLFLGGEFANNTLPARIDIDRVFYDSSFKFSMPLDYTDQRVYELVSKDQYY
jgi:hypothetical protein